MRGAPRGGDDGGAGGERAMGGGGGGGGGGGDASGARGRWRGGGREWRWVRVGRAWAVARGRDGGAMVVDFEHDDGWVSDGCVFFSRTTRASGVGIRSRRYRRVRRGY